MLKRLLIAVIIGLGLFLALFLIIPRNTITWSNDMTESVLDHPQLIRTLFHPRVEYDGFLTSPHVQPISIRVEPDVLVGGRLYPAEPTAPFILYYHGNGEIAADYDDLARFYTQQNITLLVVDYRGYGTSQGTPTGTTLLSDALAVYQQLPTILAEHNLTPSKIYVMGRSLGSVPALEIAHQAGDELAGLIIESGFVDTFALLETLGISVTGATEAQNGFGNGRKIGTVTIPTLIIHGTADVLIPATEGELLYNLSGSADKRLVLIPQAGHNDLMMVGLQQYFGAIGIFIQ